MVVAVMALLEDEPSWSVALLLASCLVSKGVGVDGLRDSLTVGFKIGCRRQKKSERPVCHTGLTQQATDETKFFVAEGKVRMLR